MNADGDFKDLKDDKKEHLSASDPEQHLVEKEMQSSGFVFMVQAEFTVHQTVFFPCEAAPPSQGKTPTHFSGTNIWLLAHKLQRNSQATGLQAHAPSRAKRSKVPSTASTLEGRKRSAF